MLPKMLIATGLMDINTNFEVDFPDVRFTTVTSILEAMSELESNKDTYDYILISATSFIITDGLTYEEIMKTFADVLKKCTYTRFALLDVNESLTVVYNKYMLDVPRRGIKNVDTELRLRHYVGMIKVMLKDANAKPVVQVVEEPVEVPKAKEKKYLFKRKKKETKEPEPEPIAIPIPEPTQAEEQETEPEPINVVEPVQELSIDIEEVIKAKEEPVKEVEKPKIKKINKQGIREQFTKSSLLFTSPCSKVGTTTAAIITARALASCGGTVCYVQLSDELFTCNLYIKSKDKLEAMYEQPFKSKNIETASLSDLVSVYQDVHLVTNTMYDRIDTNDLGSVIRLFSKINKSFDTVVYDISFIMLKRIPALITMFKYKNLVLTNSIDSLAEFVDKFEDMYQSENDNCFILFDELIGNSSLVVSRYEERVDIQGDTITKEKLKGCLVDMDDQLSELEFAPIIGCIYEDSLRYSRPFDLDNAQYGFRLLEKMR